MGVRRVSGQDPGLDRKRSDMPMDTENVCRSRQTGSALKHLRDSSIC
jgi:hypothetical protein